MTGSFDPVRLSSPDWLLAGFDLQTNRYHLAQVSRQTYEASAFLDHRIRPLPTASISLDGRQVDEVLGHSRLAQVAWVFHTGFCCSTLLATCLDHPGKTLVLREPLVLSRLAHAKRQNAGGDAASLKLLTQRVTGLCERSYAGEPLLIKPSNFANSLIVDLFSAGVQLPQRKAVLMTSNLESLLVSILKKQAEAEVSLPGFLRALLLDSDYLQVAGQVNIDKLNLLQQSVLFWHCQRYFLQQCLAQSATDSFLLLSMERFLAEPQAVLLQVSHFLRLGLPQETIQQTVQSGAFRRHSKQADQEYDAEIHRQEHQATAARFRSEIAEALEWAKPLLDTLPVKAFDTFEQNAVR
jgi:hypothetical protein